MGTGAPGPLGLWASGAPYKIFVTTFCHLWASGASGHRGTGAWGTGAWGTGHGAPEHGATFLTKNVFLTENHFLTKNDFFDKEIIF